MWGVVVLLAVGAEPQCPTNPPSCAKSLIPTLGSGEGGEVNKDVTCNTTSWMVYDYCQKKCPMRLVITDPPELRTWMCAMDNVFEPYAPDAHIDLYHPLNHQELEIEAVGDLSVGTSRGGCESADYAVGNKSFTGKIALARDTGSCSYPTQGKRAQAAGASMLAVVDYWPYYWWWDMPGSSEGVETFPTFYVQRHEADYVFAALDRGVKVKGKFQYQCEDMPAGYLDNPQDYPWDYCPTSTMALSDTCGALDSSTQEPLCEVCTVELQLPGAEKLCMMGNLLLPRTRETLMHTSPSWSLPYTTQQDEVVYTAELPKEGCEVSDFAGLAGKILLIAETGACPLTTSVRSAQTAGVAAYIMVSAPYYMQWYRVRGYSHNITIPVHTVDYHSASKLQAFARDHGRHIPGSGYALVGVTLSRGELPPTDAPTPAPLTMPVVDTRPKLDTSPDFKVSGVTAVCLAVVCVDVIAFIVMFVLQRRSAVQLPAEVKASTFNIPLKVASTGLSVTLLLLIACVSFSLATVAGQQSTDRAIENGRRALFLAYNSSEKNTVELSDAVRNNIVDRVVGLLQKEIASMEYRLKVAEDIFYGFNGTWAEFDARYLTMFRLMVNTDSSVEDMTYQVFTTQGFVLSERIKTDDRPDDVRNDGVVGSVAETNEGWRYGVNMYNPQLVSREPVYAHTVTLLNGNASRMLAGNLGDPLALTAAMPSGHTTWIPAKLTFPVSFHNAHPMASYRPLLSPDGRHVGTIEVYQQLPLFVKAALDAKVLKASNLQNMSVLVVDVTDKAMLGAHNIGMEASKLEGLAYDGVYSAMHGLYSMYEHPSVRVTALANYLDSVDGWTSHAGEFNQQDHFKEQAFVTLAKITAYGGSVADTGRHKWDVEMRGGDCGACVVFDAQLQKQVLLFDGATTLHLYRNMTRLTPIVAQSQVSGLGEPWRSRYEAFNDNLVREDGSECVARMWRESADISKKHCLVRPDISIGSEFMVSMRVRPDVAYTETAPSATTPRLFSDTLAGDANIRLFANGQLYLYVLRYGCRTKPYKDGFPVGVWTTVTAVVGGKSCRVFVNGTEYSVGHDGRDPIDLQVDWRIFGLYDVRIHANPYRSGQFFKGRIDSLQLFRHSMSKQEVQSLHTHDTLVRDVASVVQFAQTSMLDMNSETRAGVKWSVVVVVPRDDIMRVVDANRRETLEDVGVEEDNTTKELTQRANATVMVIVAIAATSVLAFFVFNHMMTQSVERFAHEILRVSQVDVEGIDTVDGSTSLLLEVNVMRGAMKTLVENMREYKTFMPEAIFADEHPTNTHEVLDAPGLSTGQAAVLFTDVQGSTMLWEAGTEAMAEALRLHNKVIREVIAEHGGYEVKTIGDAFMVAFADLDTAVRFGLRAQERLFQAAWPARLLEVVQAPGDEARGLHGLRLRMGVTHGAVNVERNDFDRYDYFGPTVNRAARLEANGACGGVAVEEAVVARIAAVQQQQALVVQLGTRTLKGIGDVSLCLLVPASLPQRVAYVRGVDHRPNPLIRSTSMSSKGSAESSQSSEDNTATRAHRAKLQAVGRFREQLTEVQNATTGHVDCEIGEVRAAAVTAIADGNLGRVVACLGRSDGRLLNVCGTAALVAWNVMAPCAGHLEAALRFTSLVAGKDASTVHCGISSGKVFSGYVGAGRQRFVTALGHCVQVCQRLYVMALQQEQAVMFAAQDTQVTDTMQARGLASPAGQLHSAGVTYTLCAVLCEVVAARLQSKKGLFSSRGAGVK